MPPSREHFQRTLPWIAMLLLAAMRLAWLHAYPLNSDEAQHAHVAWSWVRGAAIYRDTFDNHGPMFGWLHAWFMRALGARADMLFWLRLAMQVWYALALWATWCMARRLYGPGVALAAVLLVALEFRFFLISGQFRTDNMWMAMWLLGLATLAGQPRATWRWFVAGVLGGIALTVSQKTVVLLAMAILSGIAVAWGGVSGRGLRPRDALACLAGWLVVPGAWFIWLVGHGLLAAAMYDIVEYNIGGVQKADAVPRLVLAVVLAALWVTATIRLLRAGRVRPWPAWLVMQAFVYLLLVWFVWPLVTAQDFLPAIPPLLLVACGSVATWLSLGDHPRRARWLLAAACLVEIGFLVAMEPPWNDRLAPQEAELCTVLRYTGSDDAVMDPKGDAIFRRRPFYPIIESLALVRFREGLMADTVAADLVRERTGMVIRRRLPPQGDDFVMRNYLPVEGEVRIAGLRLPGGANERDVAVALPGNYTLVGNRGTVHADLDGRPATDHWELSVGTHHLRTAETGPLVLAWTPAWLRGWRPAPVADSDGGSVPACH